MKAWPLQHVVVVVFLVVDTNDDNIIIVPLLVDVGFMPSVALVTPTYTEAKDGKDVTDGSKSPVNLVTPIYTDVGLGKDATSDITGIEVDGWSGAEINERLCKIIILPLIVQNIDVILLFENVLGNSMVRMLPCCILKFVYRAVKMKYSMKRGRGDGLQAKQGKLQLLQS